MANWYKKAKNSKKRRDARRKLQRNNYRKKQQQPQNPVPVAPPNPVAQQPRPASQLNTSLPGQIPQGGLYTAPTPVPVAYPGQGNVSLPATQQVMQQPQTAVAPTGQWNTSLPGQIPQGKLYQTPAQQKQQPQAVTQQQPQAATTQQPQNQKQPGNQYQPEDIQKLNTDIQNITTRLERAKITRNAMDPSNPQIPQYDQYIANLQSQKEQYELLVNNSTNRTKKPGNPNKENIWDAALKPSGGNPFTRGLNMFDAAKANKKYYGQENLQNPMQNQQPNQTS